MGDVCLCQEAFSCLGAGESLVVKKLWACKVLENLPLEGENNLLLSNSCGSNVTVLTISVIIR